MPNVVHAANHVTNAQTYNTVPAAPSILDQVLYYALVALALAIFLLLLGFAIYYGVKFYLFYLRFKNRSRTLKDKVFLQIQIPEEIELENAAVEQLYTSFYGMRKSGFMNSLKEQDHISFEIVGTQDSIDFYAVAPKHLAHLVEKQINAVWAEAEVKRVDPWNIWKSDGVVEYSSLVQKKAPYFPINTYEDMKTDSMSVLTSVMSKLQENEALAYQMIIRPATNKWQDAGKDYIQKFVQKHNATDSEGKPKGPKMSRVDEENLSKIGEKINKVGFETVIRLVSVSPDSASAKVNLSNLERSFGQFNNPTFNTLTKGKKRFDHYYIISFLARMFPVVSEVKLPFGIPKLLDKNWYKGWSIFNTAELATLWHLPNKDVRTPKINWLRSRGSSAPIDLPESGLYLGYSEFRGQKVNIYMTEEDRRRHMYILGTTGVGKSVLMKMMAIQDIKAGKGIAFIDPHGEAVNDIVQMIPEERIDDVIYFDPASDRPMGLNILDVKTDKEKDIVINKFIDMLYELYDPNRQGIMGPQLERALRNCMLTVMSKPGGSLVEVVRLLTDENFHKTYLDYIKDPLVVRYWTDEVANTTKSRKGEVMGYFVSKLDRFVTEKTMRYMLGQEKSAFDLQYIMDNKKILLADLSKGKLGAENSKFLGLLIVPRILASAFARVEKIERGQELEDFYLYIDEFQNYTTPDIETILSEARKYKLNLAVANQFIGQLPEGVKDAIFGNVGSMAIFRVGTEDAEYLEKYFDPTFNKTDLMNNKVGRTYMKMLVQGQPSPPFAMTTDWNMYTSLDRSKERGDRIKELSRQKYGRNRFIVEQEIKARSNL